MQWRDEMTKADRKRAQLRLLAESDLALSPALLHFNLRERGAIISLPTVQRHLQELAGEGLVERVEESKGYYRITEAGRAHLRESDAE